MEAPAENTTPNPKAAYMTPAKTDAVIRPRSNVEEYVEALSESEEAQPQTSDKKKRTKKS
jgi:hypothetical protein